MPTFALPVTAGTLRAATLHPDTRANEHAETPFAALLDTGSGPKIEKPHGRPDKPQRTDKPARNETATAVSASDQPTPAKDKSTGATDAAADAAPPAKEAAAAASDQQPADCETDVEKEADSTVALDTVDPTALLDAPVAPVEAVAALPVTAETVAVIQPAPVAFAAEASAAAVVPDDIAITGVVPEASADASEQAAPVTAGAEQHPALAGKVEAKPEKIIGVATLDQTQTTPAVATDKTPATAESAEAAEEAEPAIKEAKLADKDTQKVDNQTAAEHKPTSVKPEAEAAREASAANAAPHNDAPANHANMRAEIAVQANSPLPAMPAIAHAANQPQAHAAMAAAVPISGLAVEIVSNAKDGKNRFEIRLDPPELGRIDVQLDLDGQGNVTSRLFVERQDTLDLLRRDSTALERALQDAGLKTSNDGLQFSLRDQSGNSNQQRDGFGPRASRVIVPIDAGIAPDASLYRVARSGALDIRV